MLVLGAFIKKAAQVGALIDRVKYDAPRLQKKQLIKLLTRAEHTEFGRRYHFSQILRSANPEQAFKDNTPAFDYNQLFEKWWSKSLEDYPDICWPGVIPYYALSSGTSQATSKYIPVTHDMLRDMGRGSRRMFCGITKFQLPAKQFSRQMLMIGSCTAPNVQGRHYVGDLSGIIGLNRPLWLEAYYRPGRHISDLPEWNDRIERIAQEAPQWNIGFSVANPMWLQLVLERIIETHQLKSIHEIWPDFSVFVHGGVFAEPYKPGLKAMFSKPVQFVDSYMASEGFFSYQTRPDSQGMRLLPDCGVYFELVPFNETNFDDNGDLRSDSPQTLSIEQAEEGVHYAILISTSSGAWRYLLGDTILFTDKQRFEIRVAGRTKHYLSACGEHLSVDNMMQAVEEVEREIGIGIREFTVSAKSVDKRWMHQWYISADDTSFPDDRLAAMLDAALCRLNDDYAIERRYALKEIRTTLAPHHLFHQWLEGRGRLNGQAKIPRVLKGEQLKNFEDFLAEHGQLHIGT